MWKDNIKLQRKEKTQNNSDTNFFRMARDEANFDKQHVSNLLCSHLSGCHAMLPQKAAAKETTKSPVTLWLHFNIARDEE